MGLYIPRVGKKGPKIYTEWVNWGIQLFEATEFLYPSASPVEIASLGP